MAGVYVADVDQSIHGAHTIGSTTDNDYLVLGCGLYGNGTTPEYLDRVWIEFSHAVGEIGVID